MAWLEDNSGCFPMKATAASLYDLLWKKEKWTEAIFDVKVSTLLKYNVEAFFLQLIAAGMLSADRVCIGRGEFDLMWTLPHEEVGVRSVKCYRMKKYWAGLNLHKPTDRRTYDHNLTIE